jgi:hypothetical protein
MNDHDAFMLLKSETENLSEILRKEFMLIGNSYGYDFAGSCVLGSCITAIAIALNVQKHDDQDKVLSGIFEQITKQTKRFGKSVDAFVDQEDKT